MLKNGNGVLAQTQTLHPYTPNVPLGITMTNTIFDLFISDSDAFRDEHI